MSSSDTVCLELRSQCGIYGVANGEGRRPERREPGKDTALRLPLSSTPSRYSLPCSIRLYFLVKPLLLCNIIYNPVQTQTRSKSLLGRLGACVKRLASVHNKLMSLVAVAISPRLREVPEQLRDAIFVGTSDSKAWSLVALGG